MWLERIRWWLWGRRQALERQRVEELQTPYQPTEAYRLVVRPDPVAATTMKQYRADPSSCYEMRSVAELLKR